MDKMTVGSLTELFRKALQREHHNDWDMETISEAAHICANTMIEFGADGPTRLMIGDTPNAARLRYKSGGFGVYRSPSAKKRYEEYMRLFEGQTNDD